MTKYKEFKIYLGNLGRIRLYVAEIARKLEPLSFQFQMRWLLMSNGLISVNRFAEEPTFLVSVSLIYVVMA